MKICVYAIARDEAKFARRWFDAMREADCIVCLDTGSKDGTPDILRALGAGVEVREISPWRFDAARNASLALVPEDTDVCVCTDLDEVFRPGWREALEKGFPPGATRARYRYTWSFSADGREGVVFHADKIHVRNGYRWAGPVHETLRYGGAEKSVLIPEIQLDHHPDGEKSRAGYLPLLELAVREEPENDRNTHYLGREYFFHGRYGEAMETLMRHLALPSAKWDAERAASMRYLAKCCEALGEPDMAELWLHRAICEAPDQREAPVQMAKLMYAQKRWKDAARFCGTALKIRERGLTYITEPEAWGALPWDILSIAQWELGERAQALKSAGRALELEPDSLRIRENVRIMEAV